MRNFIIRFIHLTLLKAKVNLSLCFF